MNFTTNYLQNITFELLRYKTLGDKTFSQLSEENIQWTGSETDRSISLLVKHIAGNMLSRFTNFLTEDGEKSWRNRENEFTLPYSTKSEMITAWEKGWECLLTAIKSIDSHNFDSVITIRNEAHTLLEAFNRQLAHYAYHIGQIVLLGKMIKGNDWKSLSIPKGESEKFNHEKFSN